MREIDGKKYYTAEEVADKFGMHTQTVRRWIHTNKLPAVKLGKGFWIYDEDVKELLSTEKIELSAMLYGHCSMIVQRHLKENLFRLMLAMMKKS